jgi:hypothetical protein
MQPFEPRTAETWVAAKRAFVCMTPNDAAARWPAGHRSRPPNTLPRLGTERFGSRRASEEKYTHAHKSWLGRTFFRCGALLFALQRGFAVAGTRARLFFVASSAHSITCYYAVLAVFKTAARRPHRWIADTQRNRLVPSASRHDAPLRSYS